MYPVAAGRRWKERWSLVGRGGSGQTWEPVIGIPGRSKRRKEGAGKLVESNRH